MDTFGTTLRGFAATNPQLPERLFGIVSLSCLVIGRTTDQHKKERKSCYDQKSNSAVLLRPRSYLVDVTAKINVHNARKVRDPFIERSAQK